jgi:Ser/Thr protein kinase RdoA (MazF antagonist)
MAWNSHVSAVLRNYPLPPPDRIEPLDNAGGFSGAKLWRLTIGPAQFCLRRWPEGASPARLTSIFQVVRHVAAAGLRFVPVPLSTRENRQLIQDGTCCWSLEPWLPGQADPHTPPSPIRLQAALQALARFHLAAATFPGNAEFSPADHGPATGLEQRCHRLNVLLTNNLAQLETAHVPQQYAELRPRRDQLLAFVRELGPQLQARFEHARQLSVSRQVCLRDVWSAHVLFTEDEVTGFVDFDAMRVDNVATDVARLLGSYASDDATAWQTGLAAYAHIRPLSFVGRELIACYDKTSVLLAGIQWLEWLLLEGRQFALPAVLERLDATILRLEHLRADVRTSRNSNIL